MSYLSQLKALNSERGLPKEPTEPTEGPFVSFVSAEGRGVSKPTIPPAQVNIAPRVSDGSHPREWAEGYARLCRMRCPDAYYPAEWQQLRDDAGYFLERWAGQCSSLGWSLVDVFGVALTAPQARHDAKGLVPLLDGKKIVAVTAELAVIETATGNRLRYFRRKHKPSCPIAPIWSLH